jgi:hypothetical protein
LASAEDLDAAGEAAIAGIYDGVGDALEAAGVYAGEGEALACVGV